VSIRRLGSHPPVWCLGSTWRDNRLRPVGEWELDRTGYGEDGNEMTLERLAEVAPCLARLSR
jgi:hypothetical protein